MIRHLRVANFKSLRDLSLDLGVRNVVVGPNMSGKSNLISVFRFLRQLVTPQSGAYGLPSAINAVAPGAFTELVWHGPERSDLVTISLGGDFAGFETSAEDMQWHYRLEFLGTQSSVFIQNHSCPN